MQAATAISSRRGGRAGLWGAYKGLQTLLLTSPCPAAGGRRHHCEQGRAEYLMCFAFRGWWTAGTRIAQSLTGVPLSCRNWR